MGTVCAIMCILITPLFDATLSVVGTTPQTFPFCVATVFILLLQGSVPALLSRGEEQDSINSSSGSTVCSSDSDTGHRQGYL